MIAPLFILAPPRSFTSISCAMIGNHPAMYGVAEINLFMRDTVGELNQLYSYRARYQHGLLRTIAELGLGGQDEDNIEAAKNLLAEMDAVPSAELFNDLATWAAPRQIVDKSPMYVVTDGALDRIGAALPHARFLHLLRHPRGTCESIYKLRQQTQAMRERMAGALGDAAKPQEDLTPEAIWHNPHRRIVDFLAGVPAERQMRIKGEVLLSDPARYLVDIAGWLGVATDEQAVDAMLHPERSAFAGFGPRSARFGNDPNFLKQPELREYRAKQESLDGPMSWDTSVEFSHELRALATDLGYQ